MPRLTVTDQCRLVAARLKTARDSGDLNIELVLQQRLDKLLEQLHAERTT